MNRRNRNRSLAGLALCLSILLPAAAHAEQADGPAETTGEKIDETADKLREGAKKGIDKARETLEETGKAISEGAQEAADSVSGKKNQQEE